MTKPILNVAIVLTGIALGGLHYKLKPDPSEREIRMNAQGMMASTDWQGQIAPNFELRMTNGERFEVAQNVGKKVIVLNFFATWCGPCRAEMPELNRYFNQHKSEDFVLVGIDAEEKQDQVDDFLHDLKLDFAAGIDQGAIQKQYGVKSFPTTVLIGLDGKVQLYETGALANADVLFNPLLRQNQTLRAAGKTISPEDYKVQAEKQAALPSRKYGEEPKEDLYKLDDRGKRIVAKMDCPCGCDKKVNGCTCNTSNNIKKALANEDFKKQPDADIMKALNKRFCSGAM